MVWVRVSRGMILDPDLEQRPSGIAGWVTTYEENGPELYRRCGNCCLPYLEHSDEKCLFGPTRWEDAYWISE